MESKIEIKLKWENDNFFEMTAKTDSEATTIVRVEENGCIETLWSHISSICKAYLAKQLDTIGEEMTQ